MDKQSIINEIIKTKKEINKGEIVTVVDGDAIDSQKWLDTLLNMLVETEYEDTIKELWSFEIRHIHESYEKELANALQSMNEYDFIMATSHESDKATFIKEHWEELKKIMETLYNLCGFNVIDCTDGENA